MIFRKYFDLSLSEIGGFVIMYFVFTTILYFILKFADKLPDTLNYFSLMIITLFIILVGILIKLTLIQ